MKSKSKNTWVLYGDTIKLVSKQGKKDSKTLLELPFPSEATASWYYNYMHRRVT